MTDAEKRLAVGYPAAPELPATKFNPNHDSAGRFSSGDGSAITPVAGRLPFGRLPTFKTPKAPETQKPPKIKPPPAPPGTVRNDLGKVWGRRPDDTRKMIAELEKAKAQDLLAGGFTRESASAWQRVYANDLIRNPSNQAAAARIDFIKKFLDLTK